MVDCEADGPLGQRALPGVRGTECRGYNSIKSALIAREGE